jgi:acyl-coenzyme A thioesterase PaaI-like protein
MIVEFPEHGYCFVCGTENPHSIGVRWFRHDDGVITAEIVFTLAHQGPPGFAHGGSSAAVLDEGMGFSVWGMGYRVVAANINIDYRKPVPLNEKIFVEARQIDKQGRKVYATGEIKLADGTIAVRSKGLFIEAPHIFENLTFPAT